jgi:hypothetical protein
MALSLSSMEKNKNALAEARAFWEFEENSR